MARQKRNIRLVNPALVTAVLGITLLLSLVNFGPSPLLMRSEPLIGDFLIRQRNAFSPQPIADQITLIGIDDRATERTALGVYGKGIWVTRKPFTDQLPYFSKVYQPRVVAYDLLLKSVEHADYRDNLIETPERLKAIVKAIKGLVDGESEITDDTILIDIVDLTFKLADLSLAVAMLTASSDDTSKVVLGYHFREDSTNPWKPEAILGEDDEDLSEDNGLLVSYLRDVRIPEANIHGVPDDYPYYKYAADLPTTLFLDYVSPAYIDVARDDDGLIRRVQLIRGMEYSFDDPATGHKVTRRIFLPSYALLSCLYYWGINIDELNCQEEPVDGPPPIEVRFGEAITVRPPGQDPVHIPIDEHGRFFLDFVGQINDFDAISFIDVIDKPIEELIDENGKFKFRGKDAGGSSLNTERYHKLHDKLVMIGLTATGTTDVGPCPINSNTPLVHMHMTAASNILTGTFMRPLSLGKSAIAIVALWLLLTPCSAFLRPVRFSLVTGIAALGYFGTVYAMVHQHKFILPVIPPAVFMVSSYLAVLLYNYLSEQREKKMIRGMFSTMVSGDVLNYLEENPESFSLAGQKMEATMFFSDLAGFTTISETLGAEKLVELLNAYLSPMTNVIMDSNGYVDKYEGDAIMAVWGVPYPLGDHATRACWAALDQQKLIVELAPRFKKEFGVDVMARMGLNSGVVAAGNMGSEKRFSYTVMGDAVNQAARFEPANKDYETLIMIGQSTYELAKNDIEARLLDKIIVKGKTVPIQVYELMAKKDEISDHQRQVLELYDLGLKIHWERNFEKAIQYFEQVLAIIADDGPSLTMIERVKKYIEVPPPDTWQGEFVRATK